MQAVIDQAVTDRIAALKVSALRRGVVTRFLHVSPEGWPPLPEFFENMAVVVDDELPCGQAVIAGWNMRRSKELSARGLPQRA